MGGISMDTIKRTEELCIERGLTYATLARQSGLSLSLLSTAKARKSQLSVDSIELICKALDIPLWYFFDVQEYRKAET